MIVRIAVRVVDPTVFGRWPPASGLPQALVHVAAAAVTPRTDTDAAQPSRSVSGCCFRPPVADPTIASTATLICPVRLHPSAFQKGTVPFSLDENWTVPILHPSFGRRLLLQRRQRQLIAERPFAVGQRVVVAGRARHRVGPRQLDCPAGLQLLLDQLDQGVVQVQRLAAGRPPP